MNSFLILPEDINREIYKYLHKQYYDVLLVELLDMTCILYRTLNNGWLLEGEPYVITNVPCCHFLNIPFVDVRILVPRWLILPGKFESNILVRKKHLQGKMIALP